MAGVLASHGLAGVEEAEMLGEMDVEQLGVEGGVVAEDFEDGVFEALAVGAGALGEDGAEGDVEKLAAGNFVEVKVFVFGGANFGELGDLGVGG